MSGQRLRFRGLFRKYFLVLFLAVVIPLAANGVSEAWFGYRDQRARLDQLLGVEARSAASRIQGFIDSITNQLGWLVQLPWTEEPDERRRIDALRLLRQVPAIVSLTLVDGSGRERLYVSRIGLNRTESRTDRSAEAPVAGARSARIWYGEVSYYRGSEPYLTVAISGNRPSVGVVVAEVNLKLIWDVISAIKVGRDGLRLRAGCARAGSWPIRTSASSCAERMRPRWRPSGRSGKRLGGPVRDLQPVRTRRATPLRRQPRRFPALIGRSWSSSRSPRPSGPSMRPCGGQGAFFSPAAPSRVCSPLLWPAG